MVSDKMIDTVEHYQDSNGYTWGGVDEIAQAVVNAAWHKFDGENESTWPRSGVVFVIMFDGEMNCHTWNDRYNYNIESSRPAWWKHVKYYAYPQDLAFKGKK